MSDDLRSVILEISDLRRENAALRTALSALFGNPHLDLGDLVYQVREREGEGWEGASVKAWSDAVTAGRHLLSTQRTTE